MSGHWYAAIAAGGYLALCAAIIAGTAWAGRRRGHGDRLAGEQDRATWDKPPASASPQVPGSRPGPGTPFTPPSMTPGPGHHRGNHLVIDTWECGCIYTWTRATGWAHDTDCIDEQIRRLLTS